MNAGADRLTIQVVEGGLQITDSRDRARVLRTDREWRETRTGGEAQAFWKKSRLVVKSRGRQQAAVQQEYALNRKGQLVVATTIQMGGDQLSLAFKRVYDRREGA